MLPQAASRRDKPYGPQVILLEVRFAIRSSGGGMGDVTYHMALEDRYRQSCDAVI